MRGSILRPVPTTDAEPKANRRNSPVPTTDVEPEANKWTGPVPTTDEKPHTFMGQNRGSQLNASWSQIVCVDTNIDSWLAIIEHIPPTPNEHVPQRSQTGRSPVESGFVDVDASATKGICRKNTNTNITTDDPEPETLSPRSVAVTATAAELGIQLDKYDPVLDGVEGVEMPEPDEGDE